MTQIAYSGSFWAQFCVSRDLFTDLNPLQFELSCRGNFQQPIEFKIVRTKKIYQPRIDLLVKIAMYKKLSNESV